MVLQCAHLLHHSLSGDLVGVQKLLVFFKLIFLVKTLHLTHDVKECFENEILVRDYDRKDRIVVRVHRYEDLRDGSRLAVYVFQVSRGHVDALLKLCNALHSIDQLNGAIG